MRQLFIFAILIFIILNIVPINHIMIQPFHKKNIYQMALNQSIKTNKKLLVIGDPSTGALQNKIIPSIIGTYGCGDECMDLTGCPQCKGNHYNDINQLKYLPTNSRVIFLSNVLEYVENLDTIIQELYRVSGGDIYVISLQTPITLPYYDMKLHKFLNVKHRIITAPPKSRKIIYKKGPHLW